MDLRSIRFCFSMKNNALFRLHFFKSISALSRLSNINQNFAQKFCEKTMRAILIKLNPVTKICLAIGSEILKLLTLKIQ